VHRFTLLGRDLGVHRVGSEFDVAGPGDGTVVDEDLREELLVPQWGECAGELLWG